MKSYETPWTHTAKTAKDLTLEFGPSGVPFKYTVTVPAGTQCRLLKGGMTDITPVTR